MFGLRLESDLPPHITWVKLFFLSVCPFLTHYFCLQYNISCVPSVSPNVFLCCHASTCYSSLLQSMQHNDLICWAPHPWLDVLTCVWPPNMCCRVLVSVSVDGSLVIIFIISVCTDGITIHVQLCICVSVRIRCALTYFLYSFVIYDHVECFGLSVMSFECIRTTK